MSKAITTVVFDLGGVLIDWDPRHLYRQIFADPEEMEQFLATVCTRDWIEAQDLDLSAAQATAELIARHPHYRPEIEVYHARWSETMAGPIAPSVALLERLAEQGTLLYALTNFSADTFPHAERRFGFLDHFRGLVVSGREGVMKPDPAIFDLLIRRYDITPANTLYIDDVPANVAAAQGVGLEAHHFTGAPGLEARLQAEGLL